MNNLDIIFSCDKKFIIPLITIINSIIKNSSCPDKLRFNIVCDDDIFFYEKLNILKENNNYNFTINCITLNKLNQNEIQYINKYSYSNDLHTRSIYNFSRFWFGELFPDLDYIIYLDIDMIIEGDIFELSNFKFNDDYFFASVIGTITNKYKIKDMLIQRKFRIDNGIKNNDLAFNAGLFVTSLQYWKKHKILNKLKNIIEMRFKDRNLYRFGTQPPLNIVFYKKIIDISDKNWMVSTLGWSKPSKESVESIEKGHAKCLHWSGPKKAWDENGSYRQLYLKYNLIN